MKKSVSSKANVQSKDVVKFFEDLLAGYKAGKIVLEGEEGFVSIDPSQAAEMEVKASGKEGKVKLKLGLTWRETPKDRGPLTLTVSTKEPAPPVIVKKEEAKAPAKKEEAKAPAKKEEAKAPAKKEEAKAPAKKEDAPVIKAPAAKKPAAKKPGAKKSAAKKPAAKKPAAAPTPAAAPKPAAASKPAAAPKPAPAAGPKAAGDKSA